MHLSLSTLSSFAPHLFPCLSQIKPSSSTLPPLLTYSRPFTRAHTLIQLENPRRYFDGARAAHGANAAGADVSLVTVSPAAVAAAPRVQALLGAAESVMRRAADKPDGAAAVSRVSVRSRGGV